MAQNSDPLPYVQVDRAAKPKASTLAGLMGTTPQHALGSLIEFWDLCGDPRDIERLLLDGKECVVLPAEEVAERFEIASGKAIDPRRLAALGLLEPQADGAFRVRGMSRYFAPVRRRIQAKEAARAGGLASAKARREAFGTAQPRSGLASQSAQAEIEAAPKRSRSDARSDAEAGTEAAPKPDRTLADSVQRTALTTTLSGETPPDLVSAMGGLAVAPKTVREMGERRQTERRARKPRTPSACEALRDQLIAQRVAELGPEALPDAMTNAAANTRLPPLVEANRALLLEAHRAYLLDDWGATLDPPWAIGGFAAQWTQFLARVVRSRPIPKEAAS